MRKWRQGKAWPIVFFRRLAGQRNGQQSTRMRTSCCCSIHPNSTGNTSRLPLRQSFVSRESEDRSRLNETETIYIHIWVKWIINAKDSSIQEKRDLNVLMSRRFRPVIIIIRFSVVCICFFSLLFSLSLKRYREDDVRIGVRVERRLFCVESMKYE